MAEYRIAHIDDIPELAVSGESPLRPVRHHFGITGFGINAWTGKEAGDRIINEHVEDEPEGQEELESTGQEELYLVLRGSAVFELDGERHEAREGMLVFVPPRVKRTAFAEEAGTTIVSVGGAPGQSYTPVGWELWYPLRKQYEAGEHEEVLARLREVVAANPQYALLFYNLACLESLTGEREAAIDHLRTAVGMSEQFREFAKGDSDLDALRDEPAFEEIVGR